MSAPTTSSSKDASALWGANRSASLHPIGVDIGHGDVVHHRRPDVPADHRDDFGEGHVIEAGLAKLLEIGVGKVALGVP